MILAAWSRRSSLILAKDQQHGETITVKRSLVVAKRSSERDESETTVFLPQSQQTPSRSGLRECLPSESTVDLDDLGCQGNVM